MSQAEAQQRKSVKGRQDYGKGRLGEVAVSKVEDPAG